MSIVLHMLNARRPDTVRVTEVKSHATEADVDLGRVKLEDRLGNMETGVAADLGRMHRRSSSFSS